MFRIDRSQNSLEQMEECSFNTLGFRERGNLQEWLISAPKALGEELLIIQKEFDGFNDTRERLDLLALDKIGRIVVIENKLDDTGRDVVWQALKYAAYCSTLTKEQIIDVYRRYLERHGKSEGGTSEERICEFLDTSPEDLRLNEGKSQRIILVAAQFRKEVTSTVLWLLERGLSIRCIKVTPYKLGDNFILDAKQIIPVPEAEDFMIRMAEKEQSEAATEETQGQRHQIRFDYWKSVLDAMRAAGVSDYANISPSKDNWIMCGAGGSGSHYSLILTQGDVRTQLNLGSSDKDLNKRIFDSLHDNRVEIERRFGAELNWRRMDDKITSRITYSKAADGFNREAWPDMIKWMVEHHQRLKAAIQDSLEKAIEGV